MASHKTFYTISYKQYHTHIIMQTNNIIKQQGYSIDHFKSNANLSPRHSQQSHHCEKPELLGAFNQKR